MNEAETQQTENRPVERSVMVIFGATGDLTKRKLLPALYNLGRQNYLPEEFTIVGVGREKMSGEEFRRKIGDDLREYVTGGSEAEKIEWFQNRSYYLTGNYDDAETFEKLKKSLSEIDEKRDTGGNYCFYFATPPSLFAPVTEQIGQAGLAAEENGYWRRFIYEKPFGRDLESAKNLNAELLKIVNESQIYRIDHYLGKETVQNILVFRFAAFCEGEANRILVSRGQPDDLPLTGENIYEEHEQC